jgi:hypothetical protein
MPITDADRQKIQRVMDAYELFRRAKPPGIALRRWGELTMAEAEIATGMFAMGVRAAAGLCDDLGDPQMRDALLDRLL